MFANNNIQLDIQHFVQSTCLTRFAATFGLSSIQTVISVYRFVYYLVYFYFILVFFCHLEPNN